MFLLILLRRQSVLIAIQLCFYSEGAIVASARLLVNILLYLLLNRINY
jgi:hypothetical protein